jgi:hypothetical protein
MDLTLGKDVGRVVISHELANEPAVFLERNEGERADALRSHRLFKGVG